MRLHDLLEAKCEDLDVYNSVQRMWGCIDSADDVVLEVIMEVSVNTPAGFQVFWVYADDEGRVQYTPEPVWTDGLPPGTITE